MLPVDWYKEFKTPRYSSTTEAIQLLIEEELELAGENFSVTVVREGMPAHTVLVQWQLIQFEHNILPRNKTGIEMHVSSIRWPNFRLLYEYDSGRCAITRIK